MSFAGLEIKRIPGTPRKLEYSYKLGLSKEILTGELDFDTREYRDEPNNWENVIHDLLEKKHPGSQIQRLQIREKT